jgi:glycerol-3-phosphate O-acyltransferase
MFDTIALPVWLLVLVGVLAAIAALERIIGPGFRWVFRRRMERLVARLNTRLDRPIEPFRLMRRKDMVVRLSYDPQVLQAVSDHAAETGVPGAVAFEEAQRYAREIAPSFSALVYFGFGARAAKWLSRLLYRVRVGKVDAALAHIDRKATVIFVMNHRSNMDYVLVTWLVAGRSALSYAVGEWARVWPLSWLIRSMGAYFIRRKSRNALYRRVLARYVQMVTSEGATQAVFPEGGLSLDGRVGAAKMGLLSYIIAGFDPAGRDVVFVPTAIAYDRVLEDLTLVAAAQSGERRFRRNPGRIAAFLVRMGVNILRRRFRGFGTAAVAFGAPVSLRAHLRDEGATAEGLGARLMAEIAQSVPMLPVPLVAAAMAGGAMAGGAVTRADLETRLADLVARLRDLGAVMKLPPNGNLLAEGLSPLLARGIVVETEARLEVDAGKTDLLAFYAAAVLQRLDLPGEQDRISEAEQPA